MAKFTNLDASSKSKFIDTAQRWGRNVLTAAQRLFNRLVKSGSWDLRTEIDKNPWKQDPHGGAKAKEWFNKEVIRHSEWFVKRSYMEPGRLYVFRYLHPKYESILDFYDTQPLILALPYYISNEGNVIEQGINLHLLPFGARVDLLCNIVELFKQEYKGELYRDKQKPIQISWQKIKAITMKYGGEFAFRSYRPELKSGTVQFPYELFSKAIYLPSIKYEKMSANQILSMYLNYLKKQGNMYRPTNLSMQ